MNEKLDIAAPRDKTLDADALDVSALGDDVDAWLAAIEARHPGWDLGLERVKAVAERLGVLDCARQIILVAGTNGKGSCCEYLTRLGMAAGLRVGTSTSPHFFRFNERIRINAKSVDDQQIVDAFRRIEAGRGGISISHFEFSTLASLLIFKDAGLDLAVLEIGLGGRLDAMNIVAPDVSVIMSIALDHQQWLGDTRAAIALEKAGIMRPGVTCIYADEDPVAELVQRADDMQVPLKLVSSNMTLSKKPQLPALSLVAAVETMASLGYNYDAACLDDIASNTRLMGRNHRVQLHCPVLLDVAHNPAAAQRLAGMLMQENPTGKIHALTGIYQDKDIKGVLAPLVDLIDTWHFTSLDEARAAPAVALKEALLEILPNCQVGKINTYDKIAVAASSAIQATGEDDLLLVFGSFPVVAGGLAAVEAVQ